METIKLNPAGKAIYGVPEVSTKGLRKYGMALLTIAGADDEVSEPEMNWFMNVWAHNVGASNDLIRDWSKFDYRSANLNEILDEIGSDFPLRSSATLIYDGVHMSLADDEYALEERDAVMKTAAFLNIDKFTVRNIEGLIELERAGSKIRHSIFKQDVN